MTATERCLRRCSNSRSNSSCRSRVAAEAALSSNRSSASPPPVWMLPAATPAAVPSPASSISPNTTGAPSAGISTPSSSISVSIDGPGVRTMDPRAQSLNIFKQLARAWSSVGFEKSVSPKANNLGAAHRHARSRTRPSSGYVQRSLACVSCQRCTPSLPARRWPGSDSTPLDVTMDLTMAIVTHDASVLVTRW